MSDLQVNNSNALICGIIAMVVPSIDFNFSCQVITHLLRCHLFMEPVAVASWRQLPSLHPLWKLLVPHIRGILAINTLARQRLIPAGGVADNTLSVGSAGTS